MTHTNTEDEAIPCSECGKETAKSQACPCCRAPVCKECSLTHDCDCEFCYPRNESNPNE